MLCRAAGHKTLEFWAGEDDARHKGGKTLHMGDFHHARFGPDAADFLGFGLIHLGSSK
jgi:hypothetical protein